MPKNIISNTWRKILMVIVASAAQASAAVELATERAMGSGGKLQA